jgi:hypothetical protein
MECRHPKYGIVCRLLESCRAKKIFYELFLNEKFIKPIGLNTWNTCLQQELPKCETVCYFIFNYLRENKLKVFRWKLLQFIIPTKKWKIMENSLCNLCNIEEDDSHYFTTFFKEFWGKIKEVFFFKCGTENDITL